MGRTEERCEEVGVVGRALRNRDISEEEEKAEGCTIAEAPRPSTMSERLTPSAYCCVNNGMLVCG